MAYGLAALSASVFTGLDLLRADGCFVRAPWPPRPLRAAGFGFTLARITVRSSRTRFAGRLNSGVRPLMHPYTMLKEMLRELGAEPASEDLRPDVFGSYMATYANGNSPIRLVWDGRDGLGFVQQRRGGSWADVTDYLTEGDLEGVPQNQAKIVQFRQAVAALLR